jgi:hypothetical protein
MSGNITIEGLDLLDVIELISSKKDKFIAIMLTNLELKFPKGTPNYVAMRKIILDGMNDYTRSFLRVLFGDVEGLIMK